LIARPGKRDLEGLFLENLGNPKVKERFVEDEGPWEKRTREAPGRGEADPEPGDISKVL